LAGQVARIGEKQGMHTELWLRNHLEIVCRKDREGYGKILRGILGRWLEVDRSGSWSCPMASCGVDSIAMWGSVTTKCSK